MQSRRICALALAFESVALLGVTTVIGVAQTTTTPQSRAKAAPSTSPALIAQGLKTYGSLDCNTCHVLNTKGKAAGPDLSHIGATWTQMKLTTLIRHPQQLNPKGWMPAYGKKKIGGTQLNALTAYLANLK